MAVYTSFTGRGSKPTPRLTGSQTTPAYKAKIAAAFAKNTAPKPAAVVAGDGPATDPTELPVDPIYDATVGGLTQKRDTRLAGLTAQRTAGLSDYGYSAAYDDKGNATGLAFDPNNPYSQAALARTHYQQQKTGTNNSMAARGQLYSGSLTNAQNTNDTGFAVGEDSRQKALLRFLAANLSAKTGANNDYEFGVGQADGARTARAPSSPLYDPSTGTDQGAAPAAPAAPAVPPPAAWATTAYTNAQGHKVRVVNGRKEVFINGVWRKL